VRADAVALAVRARTAGADRGLARVAFVLPPLAAIMTPARQASASGIRIARGFIGASLEFTRAAPWCAPSCGRESVLTPCLGGIQVGKPQL
jgi:hypothetical protein